MDGSNTLISDFTAGLQELTAQLDVATRRIKDLQTNDADDGYSRRTGAGHLGLLGDIFDVKPKRGSRWNYDDFDNYDMQKSRKSSYSNDGHVLDETDSFLKFSNQQPSQIHNAKRAGAVHYDVQCHVCTVSPIQDTRWKCRVCHNYDMCSSCFEDHRGIHDMSHSFKKIEPPGSLSTTEYKKEHEVHPTPSLMSSGSTKMKRDEHVKAVYLAPTSEDFITVKGNFIQTLGNKIVSISRVENQYLWEFYCLKRKQMDSIKGRFGANEKNLFHGTKPDIIQTVCAQNLDVRLAGTNVGAMLGNGTYFASEAEISDKFATPDPRTGHKFMLQCRVLVGHWTKGQQGLRRPPEVARTSDGLVRLYDSCVDDVRNPSIFCIFDHVQYYPEYIIEYK